MTTSPQTLWKSAISLEDVALDPATMGYFHSLAQDEAHEDVVQLFLVLSNESDMTKALVARRLGKSPAQITRWFGAPGNWTLDTYTDLLLAMGYKPRFGHQKLSDMIQSNEYNPKARPPMPTFDVVRHDDITVANSNHLSIAATGTTKEQIVKFTVAQSA